MLEMKDIADLFVAAWPVIFGLDLARYLVFASTMVAILAIFAAPLAHRRIQSRTATAKDVRREIGHSLITVLLFSLVGFCVFAGSRYGAFRITSGELPASGRLLLEFVAIVLLHDAYFYWAHRAMHSRWFFRRVHRVHHKSRTPTPWAAYAFAAPEAIIEAAILPLSALVLPMHELTVLLFVTHMIVRNIIGHAGIELFPSWWLRTPILRRFTTTTHHDLHHSHGGYNFGLYFTWWDQWMKTEHPKYVERFAAATESHQSVGSTFKEISR